MTWVGVGLVVVLVALVAYAWWWSGPDFRGGFRHYWSAGEIAKRMNVWAERMRR